MPNCKLCNGQTVGGVVLHAECFDRMLAEIEALKLHAQIGQSSIKRLIEEIKKMKKDRAKAKQLFDEISAIGETRGGNNENR